MATLIQTRSGNCFLTDDSIADAKAAISRGDEITVWWFAPTGTRYKENIWFHDEDIAYIRTESDDG